MNTKINMLSSVGAGMLLAATLILYGVSGVAHAQTAVSSVTATPTNTAFIFITIKPLWQHQ
jgi:hypothetical protein